MLSAWDTSNSYVLFTHELSACNNLITPTCYPRLTCVAAVLDARVDSAVYGMTVGESEKG